MIQLIKYEIVYYQLSSGKCPYQLWFDELSNKVQNIIDIRLERVQLGNLGNYRYLDKGISELKFSIGPGYRIYFGQDKDRLIVLLCGGSKGGQKKDILRAQKYWKEYLRK